MQRILRCHRRRVPATSLSPTGEPSGRDFCLSPRDAAQVWMRKTMNANRELWEKGDFTRIAASMRQSPRSDEPSVPGGRCNGSEGARRRAVRPRRQHFRSDVRTQAIRCRQGDGPGDEVRWPHSDGELDPEGPDPGRPDPEDQLVDNLFNEQNTSDEATLIPATFLRVTVER
jgi:hypothetical protein